jgi:diguanylate cyclase (GGDEF)-like protein/PAS domain S-box-containing protein
MPLDESERQRALEQLDVLDSSPEREFDALVATAALVCGVPISLVSLIDHDRQWFKANVGLPDVTETPRDVAFCAHAILDEGIFEVPDALADPRFADNPLVSMAPDIRFYAGATLRLRDGAHVGTLCVIDRVPRQLSAMQREALRLLSIAAVQALESRRMARAFVASEARFRALSEASPLGVFATDAAGACTYTNARWQAIFGLAEAEARGDGWSRTLHPDDKAAVFAQWQRAATLNQEFDVEFRVCHGKAVRHVRSVARVLRDGDGQVTGYVGSVEDTTRRVQDRLALEASQQRVTLATEAGGIGVWELNVQTGALTWDALMYTLYGLPEGPGTDGYGLWALHLHPEDRQRAEQELKASLQSGADFRSEFRVIWADGSVHFLRASGTVTRDAEGQALAVVGVNWDVTPLRELANQLAEQHEMLRVTLQSIGDAVITTDAQSQVTWLNPAAERMTGWLSGEALGRPLTQVFHIVNEETRLPTDNPVALCLAQGKTMGLANHTMLISRSGEEFSVEDSAAPIRNLGGEILGVVLVFHDVTEQRRLSGEMSYRATHDALTGLVNRAEFETRLRRTLAKAHEDGSEHTLLYIDLDQFKLVNDACGHSVGDQLLQQVAKLLSETVRSRDTLARLGGDEFAVILEHCVADQAQRVAQQICDRMEEFRFLHDERRFRIGTSIGLVPVDKRWTDTAAAMQAADTSCYAAKEAGRNRVHAWFDTDVAMRARQSEMQWATRLEQALDEDRFVLFAQRIESLDETCAGLHAEVLIRLLDNEGGLIPPQAFLPAAERFHMATRIDRWVLKRAVQQIQAMPDVEALDALCINLSGQSVGDRAFHRHAIDALTAAGIAVCRHLCLEITETAAVTNMADAAIFIEQVRALGVRVALDDFGAGASSFGYLKTLKVDLLKIDGSFIRDLIDDPLDDAAVRCFVDVARVVGVKTVAEFVDRPEVLARVREIGIGYAQGFLLHRPEPIEQLFGAGARVSPA